jgi:hypothetical protein
MAAKTKRAPRVYGSYLFKDKEPVIDETRTLFEDVFGERINNKMFSKIEEDGGPTTSCMRAWFFGDTKRPKNETIEAAGRAIGYRRKWVKMTTTARK